MSGSLSVATPPAPPRGNVPRPPRLGGSPSEAALRRAARDFETQALGLLLQPVFATVDPSRGSFGGGAAEAQWRPMLVDAYAAAAVRAGGFGLADSVFRELSRQAARTNQAPQLGATGSNSP